MGGSGKYKCCNFWVCGWNPFVWPFNWNLFVSTLTWCYLFFSILQNKIRNFFQFFTFATFGSKRVYWLSRLFAVYWLRGRFETVIKLYSVYSIDILTEVVRNQEPNVSQNLQAWVVVLAKTLQHDKTAITKYSNYFQEIGEEWLRYAWGRTERASVLLHAQRV